MEVLVLSCGMGGGHNSAGQAVAEELRRRGHSVMFLNAYDLKDSKTASCVNNAYIGIAQRAPWLFGAIYFLGEAYRRLPVKSPIYWANGKMTGYVEQLLEEHHFDAIVSSHTFPAQTLAKMKREGTSLPKTFFVATDYVCTPFEEETDCDYTVIPSPELEGEFCRYGMEKDRLLPFGIPVHPEFAGETTREEARGRLGWEQDSFVVLLSGGSIGAGQIPTAIKLLRPFLAGDSRRKLVVICGNNRKLFEKLSRSCAGCVQIALVEKTERMADFVHGCDVFVTKPGGLSSTEAAAAGVPLIHISPIPGCESHNFRFFADRGMSIGVKHLRRELLPAVEAVRDPAVASRMREAQRTVLNRFSTSRLCDFIEETVGKEEQSKCAASS